MLEKFLQLKDRVFDNPLIFNLKSPFDGREKNLKLFRSYLKVKKNEKVLDIACGTGNFSKVTDGNYVGIDLNKKFVDYANSHYGSSNKKFIVMDAKHIHFKNKSFDKALFVSLLHHVSDEESEKMLSEACRVTKKRLLMIDLAPSDRKVIKFLYNMDRGANIRPIDDQVKLISRYFKIRKFRIINNFFVAYALYVCAPLK